MKKYTILCLLYLGWLAASAQWSTDPLVNTFVAGTDLDYTFPKVAATAEGSFYISSWKDVGSPDYFHLWLQKLDYNGNQMWGSNGIRISDQRSREWLTDYAIETDPQGNAIIALEDLRGGFGGFSHVSVYAVGPDGNAVWDSGGIQLTNDLFNAYSPTICFTHSGNVLVAWNADVESKDTNEGSFIRIQKLSADGSLLWTEPVSVINADSNYIFPKMVPVDQDDFILVWQKKFTTGTGLGTMWYTYFYAMRYGPDGVPKWTQPAKLCDHGDTAFVMPQFQLLQPFQDENQSVYVTWFDDRYQSDYCNIYIQCVDTTGKMSWPVNGMPVSNVDLVYDRVEPHGLYNPVNKTIQVFWEENRPDGIFDSFGIVGQQMETSGTLLWDIDGITFAGFKPDTTFYVIDAKITSNQETVLLIDQEFDSIDGIDTMVYDQLYATRIDSSGDQTWASPHVLMAGTDGTKFYPDMTDLTLDIFVVSWCENRNSPFDPDGSVYAQDISQKGNLGPDAINDIGQSGMLLSVYPNPTSGKSTLAFHQPMTGEVFIDILTPYGCLIMSDVFQPGGGTSEIELDSGKMPSGLYIIRARYDNHEATVKWMVIR